jgi:hypothetical protein
MGTIINFPADAVSRRPGARLDAVPNERRGAVLILPVVRIERHVETTDDGGPEEGTATRRRRRRRVRS